MIDRYEWLLFDLDNTLLDFSASEKIALEKVSEEEGLEMTEDHYQLYKTINKECWTAFEMGQLPKSQLRSIRFNRFFAACGINADATDVGRRYLWHLSQSAIYLDGAEEVLLTLSEHFKLALITNGLKEVQRPRLKTIDMDQHFEVIVVSDEIGPAKPDAAFFDHAFGEMGRPQPQKTLVIGDNLRADIQGGAAYGTDTAWFNPEKKEAYIEDVKPTYELEQVRDILALFTLNR